MVCFTMRIVQWIPILLIIIYDITVCVGSGYTQIDCGPEKFRCDNGECIANELLCNGRADCTDSSDETEDECKKSDILCPTSTFRCNYGACINEDYRCNGIQDCIDNSDETYCNRNNKTDIQKINFTHRCKHDEYGCDDGQCIHINDKCDGIPNCGDGSDETFTLCGSLFCPPTAFRCAYGACINSDLRCDGVANCADSSDEDSKFCEWPSSLSPIRSSIRTKRSLPIHRRSIVISINNCTVPPQPENGHWKLHPGLCSDEQDCNVPEGTEVGLGSHLIYSCNPGYELKGTTDVICNFQRKWQPTIPTCTGGYRPNKTEFPWCAMIYLDKLGEKVFICGTSSIRENLLITSAICVYDEITKQLYEPSRFYILTGNILRHYDSPANNRERVQRNQVKRIYINRDYLGYDGNYFRDIAILELVTPFVFSATLVPVCIDTINNSELEPFSLGKVAGIAESFLVALSVPIMTRKQCRSMSRNAKAKRYFTNDKFCAGHINSHFICDSDSGGGLVFESNNLWYLRGIVSVSLGTKEDRGTISCNNNLYSLYTDILVYISWRQNVIIAIEHNRTHILCSESSPTRCS